jgi:glutamine---fructose-6-phosphate transaminase (isomerizing)
MCGIFGINGKERVSSRIIKGLERLEYRGYDSSGIATVYNNKIHSCKKSGKLDNLKIAMEQEDLEGIIGIGHTRWATHGAPTDNNAHPHFTDKVAAVHNGIIENFQEIRDLLLSKNIKTKTETDTEVVPLLITYYLSQGKDLLSASKLTIDQLKGAFAIAIIGADYPNQLIVVKKGSPLAIGVGEAEMYIGSDAYALSPYTNKIIYLEDGDISLINPDSYKIYDSAGNVVDRPIVLSSTSSSDIVGKGKYRHYMLKEIFEQPQVIAETIEAYQDTNAQLIKLKSLLDANKINKITIIACGTSYYAAMVAKYWFESIAKLAVEIDIASEYRYRDPIFSDENLVILISQSGETADTLAALRFAKQNKQKTLSVVNVMESSIARESDSAWYSFAGPEIGVASTKAFTTQLVVLANLVLNIAYLKTQITKQQLESYLDLLKLVPNKINEILCQENEIKEIAEIISLSKDVFYIGRGISYALCLEGALKLKEISYIHAEAVAAGELKHGNIALIDNTMPVIALVPKDKLFEKTISNIQEVAARGGKIITLSSKDGAKKISNISFKTLILPESEEFINPFIYTIPIQLIAYHVALIKGTDVDQPRNLAKSVTVE